jgi:hypothetical protein
MLIGNVLGCAGVYLVGCPSEMQLSGSYPLLSVNPPGDLGGGSDVAMSAMRIHMYRRMQNMTNDTERPSGSLKGGGKNGFFFTLCIPVRLSPYARTTL